MEYPANLYSALVSVISLLVYYFTVFKAGMARGRFKVEAPSHDGPPEYLRFVRAHQNTAEHLICLLYTSPSPRDRQKSRMPSSA